MRELNIAYGNNRQAKRWVNKTIRFDDLKGAAQSDHPHHRVRRGICEDEPRPA